MFSPNRKVPEWSKSHIVAPLSHFMEPRPYDATNVVSGDHDEPVRVMVVRYNGAADEAEEVVPKETSYGQLYPVEAGDIVISNIAATYGSVAIVPAELDGSVVSSEYTVLQARAPYDPKVLQLILRSPEVRSDILLSASGANRTRTRWDLIENIEIPYPSDAEATLIRAKVDEADEALRRAIQARLDAQQLAVSKLDLTSSTAETILEAFRPPK
jgi:restriction endonuclease S subunit